MRELPLPGSGQIAHARYGGGWCLRARDRVSTGWAADLQWSAQLKTAHPEGQRERPDEAPATAPRSAATAPAGHGANSGPGRLRRPGQMRKDLAHDLRSPSHPPPQPPPTSDVAQPSSARASTSARPAASSVASAATRSRSLPFHVCLECFAPLEVAYDARLTSHPRVDRGRPADHLALRGPAPRRPGRGDTPRPRHGHDAAASAPNLAKALGMETLYVKDDSGNPTHSFKDRVVGVALAAARAFGFTTCLRPPPATSPTPSPRTRPTSGCARSSSSPTTSRRQGRADHRLQPNPGRGAGKLRRRQPALQRDRGENEDWAFVNVNVRPYWPRSPDARLRGRRAVSAGGCPSRSSSQWRPARC